MSIRDVSRRQNINLYDEPESAYQKLVFGAEDSNTLIVLLDMIVLELQNNLIL
jgi:hypothetical protein